MYFVILSDLPQLKSCPVYDFYTNKVNTAYGRSIGNLWGALNWVGLFGYDKVQEANSELSYFKSQTDNCDAFGKSICHLVRGLAASNLSQIADSKVSENMAALSDYNFVISQLNRDNPAHLLAIVVAHFNRALTFLRLQQHAKALEDFDFLIQFIPRLRGQSESLGFKFPEAMDEDMIHSYHLAVIGKSLAEDNFPLAKATLLTSELPWRELASAIGLMLNKSLIETGSLIFKCNPTVLSGIYSQLKPKYISISPNLHADPEALCEFYRAMIRKIQDNGSQNKYSLNAEDFDGLNQATIDVITEGFKNNGVTINWPSKSSSTDIIKDLNSTPTNSTPTRAPQAKKERFKISELKDETHVPLPAILPEEKPNMTPARTFK